MDRELIKLMEADTPPINPKIGNGLAVEHMKDTEKWIDRVLKAAAPGFPAGLVYLGYDRCTPEEEFTESTKAKTNRRYFDVATSHIYMVKYLFRYKGEDLAPRYLYLPYVGEAGTIVLGGSRFNISPILSDRVISVGVDNIFVRLLRDRLTFERDLQKYMENGRMENAQVAWSMIYHKSQKQKKTPLALRAHCTLVHYLFCKYGFTDTFLKFADCRPVIGGPEINSNTYPEEEWMICSTASSEKMRPKGALKGFYRPTTIRIAVRKEEMTQKVRNMICGFFYVVDHFPDRAMPEYVDNRRFWMVLMGIVLWGPKNEGDLYNDMADHISSLDEYLDALVMIKLKDIGLDVQNIYELFSLIIENFTEWVTTSKDKVASMYDKELSILYYVLFDITGAIFRLYFKLKAISKRELSKKEIEAQMNLTLRTGLIYSITKNHGEVSTISIPGDNKATKATAMLKPQSGSSKTSSRKDRAVLDDPTKQLHVSVAEVGGCWNLPKSAPDGRERLNPHAEFDDKGVIVRKRHLIALLDEAQERIRRQ